MLIIFFLFTFATLAALGWSGYELFRVREDPLGERLEEVGRRTPHGHQVFDVRIAAAKEADF